VKKIWILLIIAIGSSLCGFGLYWHAGLDKTVQPGETLRSGNSPTRIVSLAPNLTEILFALELDEKIVGVSNNSDYPAAAANKKKVGSFWRPNIETIIAAKPDLVVTLQTRTGQQKSVSDSLRRLGFKVLTLKIEKIEELFTAIREIGKATDCQQLSGEVVKNISNKLNLVQSKVSPANKVRVLWVVQVEPLRVAGRNTFINELIELAGGENAIGRTVSQYPQIGTEELLACGAETIIQSAMGKSNISEQQKAAERFWSRRLTLPAVKNNRIYVIEADTALRLGPRLPEGAETVARCLHPDSFERTRDCGQQSGPTI